MGNHTTVAVVPKGDERDQGGPLSSFFRVLYECSTPSDHVLRVVGFCAAMASGAALPCMTLVFGSSVNEFNLFGSGKQSSTALYESLAPGPGLPGHHPLSRLHPRECLARLSST